MRHSKSSRGMVRSTAHDGYVAAVPSNNSGYLLTVACPCGVTFERWITPGEADRDLVVMARRN